MDRQKKIEFIIEKTKQLEKGKTYYNDAINYDYYKDYSDNNINMIYLEYLL